MTVVGVERQSKTRQDNNALVDVAALQANYDRLWMHVRVIYGLLVVLTLCYVATAFTVFSARRQSTIPTIPSTIANTRVAATRVGSWRQNVTATSGFDGVTEMEGETPMDSMLVRRRRRASSRRHRPSADVQNKDKLAARLTRRLRAATRGSDAGPWTLNHDDVRHDAGLWMTMQSKIPVGSCLSRAALWIWTCRGPVRRGRGEKPGAIPQF